VSPHASPPYHRRRASEDQFRVRSKPVDLRVCSEVHCSWRVEGQVAEVVTGLDPGERAGGCQAREGSADVAMRFAQLDPVVLRRDLPEHGLRAGDLGAVVEIYGEQGLEVEFVRRPARPRRSSPSRPPT